MEVTLPSWRDGDTRSRIIAFLDAAAGLPEDRRVAVVDNDGTLWCERPNYAQVEFMVALLRSAAAQDPQLADRPEYAAVLSGDTGELARFGLPRVGLALADLCGGLEPEMFSAQVQDFVATARHPTLGVPYAGTVYQPMLELLDALRAARFTVFVVTGGGTEFVRAVGRQLYDVPPERVIGTLVRHDLARNAGRPVMLRTASLDGGHNEGAVKVENIQRHIDRRPIFAAGNSPGDLEMLEYAASAPGPGFALVVDHDDDEREFAYVGEGVTVSLDRPLAEIARENDWAVASMRRDWSTVFAPG